MSNQSETTTELSLETTNASNPSLEEQAAAMNAGDNSSENENPIPEKFRNADDPVASLAQAYSELERKMSSPAQDSGDMTIEKKDGMQDFTMEDMSKLSEEYSKNDGLTDETYESLAQRGLTREVVDMFINAQVNSANASRQQILSEAGLDENTWQSMADWASRNWSEEKVNEWNELSKSPNPLARKLAVENLKTSFETEGRGRSSNRVEGNPSTDSFTAFRSSAEMLEAMKDPRYDKDPAYRGDVDARIELMLRANNRL